jgi:hypothetical protein
MLAGIKQKAHVTEVTGRMVTAIAGEPVLAAGSQSKAQSSSFFATRALTSSGLA